MAMIIWDVQGKSALCVGAGHTGKVFSASSPISPAVFDVADQNFTDRSRTRAFTPCIWSEGDMAYLVWLHASASDAEVLSIKDLIRSKNIDPLGRIDGVKGLRELLKGELEIAVKDAKEKGGSLAPRSAAKRRTRF